MKRNAITAERLRQLLDFDPATGVFIWKAKTGSSGRGKPAGTKHKEYINIQIDGRQYKAHRLAWLFMHSEWPSTEIDHVNGDGQDNRPANLRLATRCFNMQNKRKAHKNSKTGLLGVAPQGDKFRARIHYRGKYLSLGMYDAAEQAHAAYLKAKRQLHEGNTL